MTRGEVTAVDGVGQLTYAGVPGTIAAVLTIDAARPYDQVSAPGDSGSLWCDLPTTAAVGLHFAGGDHPERALAGPAHRPRRARRRSRARTVAWRGAGDP